MVPVTVSYGPFPLAFSRQCLRLRQYPSSCKSDLYEQAQQLLHYCLKWLSPCTLYTLLYWPLEPVCEILMLMWSFGPCYAVFLRQP